ncbi:MAG: phosphatase PAP2 family protein, partial [Lachnospiraceae bacterium]|nr:phosphatase PAP2 family protein [Lachnospiraceae bacterium]
MIAWSRLYVGVHYPTDVLGGLVFGVTMGILGHLAADRLWPVLVNKFGKSPDTAQQANEDVGTDPADRSDMA